MCMNRALVDRNELLSEMQADYRKYRIDIINKMGIDQPSLHPSPQRTDARCKEGKKHTPL